MLTESSTGIVEHAKTYRTLSSYVRELQGQVPSRPVDSSGTPKITGYVDPGVLLSTGFSKTPQKLLEQMPEGLIIPLSYSEGFPTVEGIPFWERLDGEPLAFYDGFKAYRDMPYKLITRAEQGGNTNNQPLVNERSVREVALRMGEDVSTMHSLSISWHWKERVRAFDLFRTKSVELTRAQLTMEMENTHQQAARKIFEMCTEFMIDNKAKLTPTTALKWTELMSKLERLSLGQNPDKPNGEENHHSGTLVQVTQNNVNNTQQNMLAPAESKERVSQVLEILYNSGAIKDLDEVVDGEVVEEGGTKNDLEL